MSAPDFAAIITARLAQYDIGKLEDPSLRTSEITEDLLTDSIHDLPGEPTIGQLLAIGAAVMTADDANPNQAPIYYRGTDHHVWASGWDAALDSLRAVQP